MEKESVSMEVNIKRLREEIIDYYGTAMCNGFQMAVIDLQDVYNATDEEIIEMAIKLGKI